MEVHHDSVRPANSRVVVRQRCRECLTSVSGVKFFNWIGKMWKGHLTFETPMLFSVGFIVTFLFGGVRYELRLGISPAAPIIWSGGGTTSSAVGVHRDLRRAHY